MQRKLKTEEERRKTDIPGIHHWSNKGIVLLGQGIVVAVSFAILLIPILLLFLLPLSNGMMAGIVVVFTLLFPVVLSILAQPRIETIFGMSAAYVLPDPVNDEL